MDNNLWCSDQSSLKQHAADFFLKLYSDDSPAGFLYPVRNHFPKLSTQQTRDLEKGISEEEIRAAVFGMDPTKAPGLDGLNAHFYQHNWGIVRNSVYQVVREAFEMGKIDKELNRALVVLIPKTSKPESMKDFRPISLINICIKVITKIIANRLRPIMPIIIGPAQTSFIAGRSIVDNIISAQEIIHSMRFTKGKKGWLAVKVDLEKAFDRISWNFIRDTLDDAKILAYLSNTIMSILSSSSTQICWNSDLCDPFTPSRGVRQGDPISPFIFVLCMERLAHSIELEVKGGRWKPFCLKEGSVEISNFFFADDLILFTEASVDQVDVINKVLELFRTFSGQAVSKEKTSMYVSPNIENEQALVLSNNLGVKLVDNLGTYLGTPIIME